MRKLLVVLAFLIVVGCCSFGLSALAVVEDSGDAEYSTGINKTYDIVPTVQIHEPGAIRVQISWTAPQLTFVRRERVVDGFAYYALKDSVSLGFEVSNLSRASTNAGFNGKIRVTGNLVEPVGVKRDNVKVVMESDGVSFDLGMGEKNNSYKLLYSNRGDALIEGYTTDVLLAASQSADSVKANMLAQVKFVIAAAE